MNNPNSQYGAAPNGGNPNSVYGAAPGTGQYGGAPGSGYPNTGDAGGFGLGGGGGGTIAAAQGQSQRHGTMYLSTASNRSSVAPMGSPANYDAIPELRSGTPGAGGGQPAIQYGTLAGVHM